jgi:antitoxin YefM
MKAVSYSEARNNLKTYLDYVNDNHDIVTIVRQNGSNIVMMSEDDYNSINETLYLLSSSNNRKHLMDAIKNKGKGKSITLKSQTDIDKLFGK